MGARRDDVKGVLMDLAFDFFSGSHGSSPRSGALLSQVDGRRCEGRSWMDVLHPRAPRHVPP